MILATTWVRQGGPDSKRKTSPWDGGQPAWDGPQSRAGGVVGEQRAERSCPGSEVRAQLREAGGHYLLCAPASREGLSLPFRIQLLPKEGARRRPLCPLLTCRDAAFVGPGWSGHGRRREDSGLWLSDPVRSRPQMRCCGVTDYTDWYPVLGENTVPDRCCMENSQGCGRNSTTPLWRTVRLDAAPRGLFPEAGVGHRVARGHLRGWGEGAGDTKELA